MKINFTKIVSSFAVCAMTIFAANAATFTAIASGSWSSAATWSGGNVPGNNITGDDIIIGSGFIVDLDQDVEIGSILLVSSGSLDLDGTLSSSTSGRTLTFTGGSLQGTGNIAVSNVKFNLSSTLGFTGTITADEMENRLSLVTAAQIMIKRTGRMMGNLTIGAGGKLELDDDATLVIEGGSILTTGNGSLDFGTSYNVSYQGSSSTSGSELSGSGLKNVTVDIGLGNSTSLGSDVVISGTLFLSTGTFDMNGHNLTLKGDVSATGTGELASDDQSDLIIEGAASLSGVLRFSSTGNNVRNLTINRTGTGSYVAMGSDLKVSGILNFMNGNMRTNNYALDIMSSGSITGASKDRYVQTGTSGKLGIVLSSGGSLTTYPVGTQERYMPGAVRIASGMGGMVRINTINEVYANGTSGTDISTTEKMVKGTWNITSELTAGFNLDVKTMWQGSSEVNSFNRSNSYISHYTAGSWDLSAAASATAEADGMFSLTRTGVNSLSPFSVRQSNSSGVADINALSNASVYPNPATSYLMINNVENVEVEVINELGQVVKRSELNGSASLDLSDLQNGNYFIKISSNDASTVKRFVKM